MSYRYGIRITRHHYFSPANTTEWVRDPADSSRDLSFAARREALDWIDDYETQIYETSYGECGHPSYRVVRLDGSEPQGFLD